MQKINQHTKNRLSVLKLPIDDNIVYIRQSFFKPTLIKSVFHTLHTRENFKSEKIDIKDIIIKHKHFLDNIKVELQKEYNNFIKNSTLEFLYDTFDIKYVLLSNNIHKYVKEELEVLKNIPEEKLEKLINELFKLKDCIIEYNYKQIISSKQLLSKLFNINILCLDPSTRMLINKEKDYEKSIILIEYNDREYEPVGKMIEDEIIFEFFNDDNLIINL